MHPALAALTPSKARRLILNATIDDWCEANGVPWSNDVLMFAMKRMNDPEPPPPPPPPNPRRHDERELTEFVATAAGLPARLADVADLVFKRGYTLDQCAERLGIKRETVRAHLRRLRLLQRMVLARNQ